MSFAIVSRKKKHFYSLISFLHSIITLSVITNSERLLLWALVITNLLMHPLSCDLPFSHSLLHTLACDLLQYHPLLPSHLYSSSSASPFVVASSLVREIQRVQEEEEDIKNEGFCWYCFITHCHLLCSLCNVSETDWPAKLTYDFCIFNFQYYLLASYFAIIY